MEPLPTAPRIAAIVTEWRRTSHADVILTKFLEGCEVLDMVFTPRVRIASLYTDQLPPNDLSRDYAAKHGVPVFSTIEDALTLGTGKLAVDGVLLIGEHGDYPMNEKGQQCYPRRRFFEETAAVIRRAGRPVPVFNDKHLAYAWEDARWIYDTARELRIPLMAGSSIPLAWRTPPLELPAGCDLEAALAVGYGGLESYGFHTLEVLECMAERRRGGETGVEAVECISGEEVWRAGEAGRWALDLLPPALAVIETTSGDPRAAAPEPHLFLIEYRDGFRAAALTLEGHLRGWTFAGRLRGEAPVATQMHGTGPPVYGHFARLCEAVQQLFLTGRSPVPVERTLLVTGILDAAMQSHFEGGRRIETPWLRQVAYAPA